MMQLSSDPNQAQGLDQVHVWQADLDVTDERLEGFRSSLDPQEIERAQRLRTEELRRRFIARRGILREILARYVDLAPAQVQLTTGPHGKPALAQSALGVEFNLSHSGRLALYAITRRRQVGIDVERIRTDPAESPDVRAMARQFFAPGEVGRIEAQPADEQLLTFYRIWTLKEAYVKAAGPGFFMALDSFEMQLDPPGLGRSSQPAEQQRWSLRQWQPEAGCLAALAVEGSGFELCTWPWRG